ncbi:MAG: Mut7-C RNAse domain-containing protein [Elusimicrobiota bacterium]
MTLKNNNLIFAILLVIIFSYGMKRAFIVDFMLGRLCRWLRLIGEDALYYREDDGNGIIYSSLRSKRIILTRNSRLSIKRALKVCLIKSDDFRKQLKQVIDEFGIKVIPENIFTRCTQCNSMLEEIPKGSVTGKVPDYVYKTQERFSVCRTCSKIYWNGTHRDLVKKVLEEN